jgi:hypothetical protein
MTITGFYYPILQRWKTFAILYDQLSLRGKNLLELRSRSSAPKYVYHILFRDFSNGALQWGLYSKIQYTFIPLRSIKRDACTRRTLQLSQTLEPLDQWNVHLYPYKTLPHLECHLTPSFAAINGGPKCAGTDLDAITLDYCQSSDSRPALKRRLELLCEIWKLFQDAKEDASNWERGLRGKRKREQEDEDIERLTQSSQRTTRSHPPHISQGPIGDHVKHIRTSGSRKRKAAPSLCGTTLTERAVFHLSKRQKTFGFRAMVKHWAESIHD